MQIEALPLSGAMLIKPKRFTDDRGYFEETYHLDRYAKAGIPNIFVQDNHSVSHKTGTLRGLHFQRPPKAQAKLVSCTRGRLLDVLVDLRKNSSTFKQSLQVELTPDNGWQIFIPAGFAHGFLTLEDNTEAQYKVTALYDAALDSGIAYNDPDLGIDWGLSPDRLTLSEKDRALPTLAEAPSPFQ